MLMNYDVQVEEVNSRPLALVRRRATSPDLAKVVPEACGTVWNSLRNQKIKGAGRHVAIYLDDQINLEVGVELEVPYFGQGEVIGSATPAGKVASTVHFGPYNRLSEARRGIREWCMKHGYSLAGPNWEVYRHWKDEWNTGPTKIRTDVFYLLKADG